MRVRNGLMARPAQALLSNNLGLSKGSIHSIANKDAAVTTRDFVLIDRRGKAGPATHFSSNLRITGARAGGATRKMR